MKISFVVSDYLKEDRIFSESRDINRDNIFDRFHVLKGELELLGCKVATQDIIPESEADLVIYSANLPSPLPNFDEIKCAYLILSEPPVVIKDNYDISLHHGFRRIFTWDDNLVDDDKYFKLNYAHKFPDKVISGNFSKKKLCTVVAGNKKAIYNHERELYSERVKAIRWFEKNASDDFSLYGIGWDKHRFYGPKFVRALNRVPFLGRLVMLLTNSGFPSYRGRIDNKLEVMKNYKFSICFENLGETNGYISEKIFDSIFAGCIPVYLGAKNIGDFIPKNCYIDMRDYSSYDDLYKYISNMSESDYESRIKCINSFISSDKAYPFKSQGFSDAIIKIVREDFKL